MLKQNDYAVFEQCVINDQNYGANSVAEIGGARRLAQGLWKQMLEAKLVERKEGLYMVNWFKDQTPVIAKYENGVWYTPVPVYYSNPTAETDAKWTWEICGGPKGMPQGPFAILGWVELL